MEDLFVIIIFVLPLVITFIMLKAKPRKVYILKDPEGLYIISYKWFGFSEYGDTSVSARHIYINMESGTCVKCKVTDNIEKVSPLINDHLNIGFDVKGSISKEVNIWNKKSFTVKFKKYQLRVDIPKWYRFGTKLVCSFVDYDEIKWKRYV